MFNIVLVEPEIPQNTGNIVRTCAATDTKLHLVRPLGFEISDKYLKRAGLDYWPFADISYYDSLSELFAKHPEGKFWYLSTKGKIKYTDVKFEDNCFLVFGKETKGLPEDLLYSNYDRCIRIPMYKDLRSLNLSNSVAIVLYEALRQFDFFDLK
jgi:tRNA (cytidine/uridine-2'-O-)-methyltransferase